MLKKKLSQHVEEQLRKSVFSYAIYRPESALIIAMTIIAGGMSLLNLPWFPGEWWLWLLFGVAGESLIVWSTLHDDKFYQTLLDDVIRQEFNIDKLRSSELRQKLAKAIEYHELVFKEIEREDDPVLDDYLLKMAHSLEDWIARVHHLTTGLDAYRYDPIINRDMEAVPKELEKFKHLLALQPDNPVQEELEKTIAAKQAQWDTLQKLRDTMTKAQLQLENTLSAMGTVYMQVVLLGSKEAESPRAQRLQEDMVEQVRALEDISLAMDEVYQISE